ncbi:MAG: DUF192 domain-containing protein [Gemmatimonadetes bacterium]|nr:DUF192 domain-containing protein [Gemmatimonadota bacterium]
MLSLAISLAGCLVALLAAVACAPDTADTSAATWVSPVPFDSGIARIITPTDTVTVLVEIAATPSQREFGLMDRPALDSGSGMVFLYDEVQDSSAAFWMFRTRIPLDIAFVDSTGRIASIRSMTPCESPNPGVCPRYASGVPYRSVLEVNRGFLERNGITTGSRFEMDTAMSRRRP